MTLRNIQSHVYIVPAYCRTQLNLPRYEGENFVTGVKNWVHYQLNNEKEVPMKIRTGWLNESSK